MHQIICTQYFVTNINEYDISFMAMLVLSQTDLRFYIQERCKTVVRKPQTVRAYRPT